MVWEEGKYYTAILAYPGVEKPYLSEEEYIYGKYNIDSKDAVLKEYLEKEYSVYNNILSKLNDTIDFDKHSENKEDNSKALERKEKRLEMLKEEISLNRAAYKRISL